MSTGPSSPSQSDSQVAQNALPLADRILWTAEQAATALGLSERTLRDLTNAGEIPVVRLAARLVRYSPDALASWAIERSESSHGQAQEMGDRDGLQAGWGRPLGRRRARRQGKAPDTLRSKPTGGDLPTR